ncbi:unnamed protein product [Durusdinium trenchii]|uniref:Uncharacterized protein n=2 Tax=Durusdinium trenchii TaxID=1381693 RepID=A0ABP0P012_9DINO
MRSSLAILVLAYATCAVSERLRVLEDICNGSTLTTREGQAIELKARKQPGQIIDTFAFGNKFEIEVLLLRLYEMGDEVAEFHIVEGDRDFTGSPKEYEFDLVRGKLDAWKHKITYHKAKIPAGVKDYDLQNAQRLSMDSEMKSTPRDPADVLLEGDLDEIVHHRTLQVLRNCEPASGAWNTRIRMGNFYYTIGWTTGDWEHPTTASFFSEDHPAKWSTSFTSSTSGMSSFAEAKAIWDRPNLLSSRDGPTGWHLGWILNGAEGLARKIFLLVEGRPVWARDYKDEAALAKFLKSSFYANPQSYDYKIYPSQVHKDDVPQALLEHPEEFPTILRGVTL